MGVRPGVGLMYSVGEMHGVSVVRIIDNVDYVM